MSVLDTLELQKRELLNELTGWPSSRLTYRISSGEWSALQMLDHIVRTEHEILAAVYRNEGSINHRFGLTDRLRNRLLIALFRTDRRVKVPASAALVLPDNEAELPALTAQWSQVRDKLDKNVERLLASYTGRAIFHHPVAGRMDTPAVLDFLSVHLLHHGFQLKRIRNASEHLQSEN
jgi:hypothetical protein